MYFSKNLMMQRRYKDMSTRYVVIYFTQYTASLQAY